jgi:hypothetical protein
LLCIYVIPSANAATAEEEVLQVEIDFIKSLTTGDASLGSSLYWRSPKTSTFYPGTPYFLVKGWEDHEKMLKYRSSVSTGTSNPIFVTFHDPQVIMIKDDVAVLTGYETLIETDQMTKKQTTMQNRFTRVLQKIGGKWLIVHDHASSLPVE